MRLCGAERSRAGRRYGKRPKRERLQGRVHETARRSRDAGTGAGSRWRVKGIRAGKGNGASISNRVGRLNALRSLMAYPCSAAAALDDFFRAGRPLAARVRRMKLKRREISRTGRGWLKRHY